MTTKFRPGDAVEIGVTVHDDGYESTTARYETPSAWRLGEIRSAGHPGHYSYRVKWKTADGHKGYDVAVERHLRVPCEEMTC